ncbi:helix-turn-helix transcriptional regulator [Lysinibacillus sp. NPDC059133]|uniref:helix-turn-helix transcriptional regulator n=1 Tax=Lysinibacillus sp. NPDC059133 TaxID=3346737 RepID=UPI00369E775B
MYYKLIAYRKKADISQEEVAATLNMTRQTYSKKERMISKFELNEAIALANLFNVSVSELFEEERKNQSAVITSQ